MTAQWKRALIGIFFLISLSAGIALADDHHRHKREHYQEDEGNEATGVTTACILGVANFSVALSILLKGARRWLPENGDSRKRLLDFNKFQKRYLMKLHYWLNPIGFAMAATHFGLSHCRRTQLPEWGLLIMSFLVLLGLMMKLKLSPSQWRKNIYKLHTHPVPFVAILSVLIIGHSILD